MLESIVELLFGLFWCALILLVGSSIVGSIVAALRGVSHESDYGRNGVQIPFGCRQGQCRTCATRILSGTVRMDVEDALTVEQKNAGYVLPCVSRATGTVVLSA